MLERADGTLVAVFESEYWLERLLSDEPDLVLEKLVTDAELRS